MWGSNPRIPEPQSGVLTTSPIPPYQIDYYSLTRNLQNIKFFLIIYVIKQKEHS